LPEASLSRAPRPSSASTASTFSRSRNGQDPVALVDDGHLRPQRAEHRRVLDPDHARADHGHGPRDARLELQEPVGVDDRAVVELDRRRPGRPRAGRDHDPGGADRVVRAFDADRVVVLEARVAGQYPDVVAPELLARDRGFRGDDGVGAIEQLLHRGSLGLLDPVGVEDVERAGGQLLQGRLAQGFRRDGPGMDRDTPEAVSALGDGDTFAELGCLDGGLLTAGTRADYEKIELHGLKCP
jgi:hypothetical protein